MRKKGFTLIELLVVVVIIGILAAAGVVSYSGFTNAAKKNVAIANYNSMVKWITIQSGFCEIDSNYNVAVKTFSLLLQGDSKQDLIVTGQASNPRRIYPIINSGIEEPL